MQNLLTKKPQFLSSNRRSPCLWWDVAKLDLLSETLLVCRPMPSSINIYPSIFHDWPLHQSDICTEKVFNSSFFISTHEFSFFWVCCVCALKRGLRFPFLRGPTILTVYLPHAMIRQTKLMLDLEWRIGPRNFYGVVDQYYTCTSYKPLQIGWSIAT